MRRLHGGNHAQPFQAGNVASSNQLYMFNAVTPAWRKSGGFFKDIKDI